MSALAFAQVKQSAAVRAGVLVPFRPSSIVGHFEDLRLLACILSGTQRGRRDVIACEDGAAAGGLSAGFCARPERGV
ncbi:MAG: hypothetical protein WBP81_05635 [Solirubrobacteraceae bacterium]